MKRTHLAGSSTNMIQIYFITAEKNTQIYVRTNPSNNEIHSITPMNNINAYMLRKTT